MNLSPYAHTILFFFYTLLSYEIPPHLASLCNWISGMLRARCTNCGSSVVGQCGGQTRVSQLSLSTTAPVVFFRSQTMTCVGNPPADNTQETTHRYYIITRRQSAILSTLLLSVCLLVYLAQIVMSRLSASSLNSWDFLDLSSAA